MAVGGWGSRVPNKYIEPCPKNLSFFQKKNALNSLKSKTNLTFTSHLVESQTCAVGGWGPMFGTKSQKNVFFLTLSLMQAMLLRLPSLWIDFRVICGRIEASAFWEWPSYHKMRGSLGCNDLALYSGWWVPWYLDVEIGYFKRSKRQTGHWWGSSKWGQEDTRMWKWLPHIQLLLKLILWLWPTVITKQRK